MAQLWVTSPALYQLSYTHIYESNIVYLYIKLQQCAAIIRTLSDDRRTLQG